MKITSILFATSVIISVTLISIADWLAGSTAGLAVAMTGGSGSHDSFNSLHCSVREMAGGSWSAEMDAVKIFGISLRINQVLQIA